MNNCNDLDEYTKYSDNHNFDQNLQMFTSSSNANVEQLLNNINLFCEGIEIEDPRRKLDEIQKKFEAIAEELDKCNDTITTNEACIQKLWAQTVELNQELESSELLHKEMEAFLAELTNEKIKLHSNVLNKHNALKTSFRLYKTCLDIHVSVECENQILSCIICFFTQKFHDEYSARFRKNVDDDHWKLFSIKPNIPESQLKEIQQQFSTTNDICNCVCTLRNIFKRLKMSQ